MDDEPRVISIGQYMLVVEGHVGILLNVELRLAWGAAGRQIRWISRRQLGVCLSVEEGERRWTAPAV